MGNKVFNNLYKEERWSISIYKLEKSKSWSGLGIRETLITGIGQGYVQTTPLQLCLMTAQLANGGFKIYPTLISNKYQESFEKIKYKMSQNLVKEEKYDLIYYKNSRRVFQTW